MTCKAPGKNYRKGLTAKEFYQMFPDNGSAEAWFVVRRWPNGVRCPKCGSVDVNTGAKRKGLPFRCRNKGCETPFSVKYGTFMQSSKITYQEWLYALYLISTNLKGFSSMKLHRELKRTQKTAWHAAHRIRKVLDQGLSLFAGPVEVDETYVGGRRRNMSASKRKALTGRGPAGKVAVVGIRDRATNQVKAKVVQNTMSETLGRFVTDNVIPGTRIYTDDATAYTHLPNHTSVKHSVREYVRGSIHTNGIESFWATLKRAHTGTFHRLSAKHLHRYVDEFVGRHNMRSMDTLDQMAAMAKRMNGTRLSYKDLVA